MSKDEALKLLVLIESVYSNFIFTDYTVQKWLEISTKMDFSLVMSKLKSHIRNSPYPPAIGDITDFSTNNNWKMEYSIRDLA